MLINGRARMKFVHGIVLLFLTMGSGIASVRADETNAAPDVKAAADAKTAWEAEPKTNDVKTADAPVMGNQDFLRSYLQIQDQLHNTQIAIEKNREEAENWASTSARVLDDRLGMIEKAMAVQRLDELTNHADSTRVVLVTAGIFGGIGFFVLIAAAVLQWTSVNRLAAVKASFPSVISAEAGAVDKAITRFSDLLDGLEYRVHSLESAVNTPPHALPEINPAHAETKILPEPSSLPITTLAVISAAAPVSASIHARSAQDKAGAINVLIGKVQTLLQMDKAEAALGCLDEVLALDPENADALVKKGAALERLQRFEEALNYYDLAIAQDNSMTMAYLYKGGVFNRMERYSEALECYEQALKTRQKGQAANVIID